ncbi:hypothetical protein ACFSOZ_18710 [Mesorhizobium newzealandense]|uniref:Uncharacterized protein n=1 Tax=Mesorhizobium newzealandense TaxID=1300302 RepID=A0ABW4UDJ6_9HYPH|nr:hypothetical protein [Mesorhizobium sophorae]
MFNVTERHHAHDRKHERSAAVENILLSNLERLHVGRRLMA